MVSMLLLVAVALRFPRLSDTPAWYTDEGFYMNSAWSLVHGQLTVGGIRDWTFLSPFSPTPPLFHAMLGSVLLVTGKSIVAARALTSLLGVLTVLSLFFISRAVTRSNVLGFVPALAYAVIPEIVINNRWSLPQNLTGLLLLWSVYFLWCGRISGNRRPAILGAIFASAALATQFWVVGMLLLILPLFWAQGWRRALTLTAIGGCLLMALLIIRAFIVPRAMMTDLGTVLAGSLMINPDTTVPLMNYIRQGIVTFFSRNPLFILSLIGVFMIRPRTFRPFLLWFLLLVAAPLIVLRADFENFFYAGLVFVPILLLGLAGLATPLTVIGAWLHIRLPRLGFVCFGILSVIMAGRVAWYVAKDQLGLLAAQRAYIYRNDTAQMREVVSFVNSRTSPKDLVVAPNAVNWALLARTEDIHWVACYEYQADFPNLWPERFVGPMGIHDAKYVVVDRLFPGDAGVCKRAAAELFSVPEREGWPVVFDAQRFIVYANPEPR